MRRLLLAGAMFAMALGIATVAQAQTYPPHPTYRGMSFKIVRIIPNAPSDTTRHSVAATPSCGAANPQGGIPTSVTWGECP